jgi:CheY-like chemotaxis protein
LPNQRVVALAANQPKYRLLIVDDKSENRKLLSQLLQPLGFDLQEASNGQTAIEVADQWHPHLIWMDMRMPVLDGYKATQQIRKLPTTPRPKIVALSASSFREEQINARAAGCDDFIHKPFHADEIFEAMGRHLGVRYRYDSEVSATEDQLANNRLNSGPNNGLLENNRLATISPELLEALESATRRLQWNSILHIIEQIRVQDEPLAQALTNTVHSFHYEHILQAIQSANEVDS